MQIVTVASSKPPQVDPVGSAGSVCLTFEGTRGEHVVDRATRVRVTLPRQRAGELRQRLAELVPNPLDWQPEVLEVLDAHRGETGADEDALEVVRRLSQFWREHH
jgi:hypothetical protein